MEYHKNKIVVIGEIIALYPHIFIAEMQGKREKIKESFTYSQVVTKRGKGMQGKRLAKKQRIFLKKQKSK